MTISRRPFYVDGAKGKNFYILFEPAVKSKTAVLILSPFAEEMNKSRRILSQQSSLLAKHGISTLIFDYFGTGDSEGDFSDATWETWESDVQTAFNWLISSGYETINLIAMRMGALLTSSLLVTSEKQIEKIIFWQPVLNGELLLNQFYRLKIAADLIGERATSSTVKDIKDDLLTGLPVEIAGYTLNPNLAEGLAKAKLSPAVIQPNHEITWFEIVSAVERPIPSASKRIIEKLQECGVSVQTQIIPGAQFWTTVELVDVPDLHQQTLLALTKS